MNSIINHTLEKSPTGVKGLDEIIKGGLPRGRVSLVCGGPGCGKTLLATEFLGRGAELFDEPGVFMAFEETAEDLIQNTASLGIDLNKLIDQGKIIIDFVFIDRSEIEETGEYDLEGLFIRLSAAIDEIGAKRVVLDTIETIFAGFSNESILRSELRRLFRFLKDKGVTTIVTGERGERSLTRYGLEEYISDCVILLDNRVENRIANRILRVVKYRGSQHGTNEYPFLIGSDGIWVQPLSEMGLNYPVSSELISTGVNELNQMLAGHGYYRGSTVLVSGTAGTGKSSLATSLVDSACQHGERALYIALEESTHQIIRNMRSIGFDLQQWIDQGLLKFHAVRPTQYGMEMHLLMIQKIVGEYSPSVVIVDPLTDLTNLGTISEVKSMLIRLIDFLKMNQITALFTSLTSDRDLNNEIGVSSLMDTWILLRNIEMNGERNRGLYLLKSRGMAHSNQVREFRLTDTGIELVDVLVGTEGVLIGSARSAFEARQRIENQNRLFEIERRQASMERRRRVLESQILDLQNEIATAEDEFRLFSSQQEASQQLAQFEQSDASHKRQGNNNASSGSASDDQ